MKKLLFGLCSIACLSACATSLMVPYQVNSNPPGAQIYVNRVLMGITPIQLNLQCDRYWMCPAKGPCHWEFHEHDVDEVTAYPADDKLPCQTKSINVCQSKAQPGHIDFDFRPDAIATQQRTDVNVNQDDKTTSPDGTL